MSRTQLQLEGDSLEELLDRVQQEHGQSARILKAEKVRRGGVGGFFARESFHIDVDVPVEQPASPAATPARSLLDLVEERNADEERHSVPVPGATSGLSTEGDAFAAVLQRLQRETGADPLPLPDPFAPLAASAPAVVPAPRRAEMLEPDAVVPMAEPIVPPATDDVGTLSGLAAAQDADITEPTPTPAPPTPASKPVAETITKTAGKAAAKTATKAATKSTSKTRAKTTTKTVTKAVTKAVATAPAKRATPARSRREPAARAGGGNPAALMHWLRELPVAPAPDLGKGAVLAVAGPARESFETAQRLALSLGLDATAAVRADATTVARRAVSWRRSTTPTVVAVEVPTAGRGRAAGEELLCSVAPTYLVGVVSATTDLDDLCRWTDRLGGVDALAVHGVDATEDPLRILQAGIPVAMLDDLPATPAVWAGLVLDRLVPA